MTIELPALPSRDAEPHDRERIREARERILLDRIAELEADADREPIAPAPLESPDMKPKPTPWAAKYGAAADVLAEFNRWRRSDKDEPAGPPPAKDIGNAIDIAVKVLRQRAGRKP